MQILVLAIILLSWQGSEDPCQNVKVLAGRQSSGSESGFSAASLGACLAGITFVALWFSCCERRLHHLTHDT